MQTLTATATATADLDLVSRHAYGDPEAFAEIYERFGGLVYGIARRMAGDEALADDLSQEIFIRVFRHLEKFQGRSSLKTWIYRIAINCCRSRLGRRAKRGRPFVDLEDATFDNLPSPAEGTDARVRRREAGEQIERGLSQLPVVFREAVILRDIYDLPYDEIAVVLNIRIGTVRSRIARGRDGLRAALTGPRESKGKT